MEKAVGYLIVLLVWIAAGVASFSRANEDRPASRYDLRQVLERPWVAVRPHYNRLLRRVRKAVAGGVVFAVDDDGVIRNTDGFEPLAAVMQFEDPSCSHDDLIQLQEGTGVRLPVRSWFGMRERKPRLLDEVAAQGAMRVAGVQHGPSWEPLYGHRQQAENRAALLKACGIPADLP